MNFARERSIRWLLPSLFACSHLKIRHTTRRVPVADIHDVVVVVVPVVVPEPEPAPAIGASIAVTAVAACSIPF